MIRVVRVLAPNPGPFTLEGTNTWIVGENPAVVIDPGPDEAGHLLAVLDAAGPIGVILVTHDHPDHAPGAARLAVAATAPVRAARTPNGDDRLRNGERIEVGRTTIQAVATPGHTQDHVAFFLEGERALFTGDVVLGRGTSVIDPPEGDVAAYLRSLRTMLALDATTIYPGHGPAVFGAKAKLEEYLAHREERERQILEALGDGAHTPEEIVRAVYAKDTPPEMFPVAERSVLAHLLKLEREGRAARVGKASDNRFEVSEVKTCQRCGQRPALPRSRYCGQCSMAVLQEGPRPG